MTAAIGASPDANNPSENPSEESLAVSLWAYIHSKWPRFTLEAALSAVQQLKVAPGENPKQLAKRVRHCLLPFGVDLKHVHALEAASLLLTRDKWHDANRMQAFASLKLKPVFEGPEEDFASWHALAPRALAWCEAWLRAGGGKIFEVRYGPKYLMIASPRSREGSESEEADILPLLMITPIGENEQWMQGASEAFEYLRRHLEEREQAVLDGVAVLFLCSRTQPSMSHTWPRPVQPSDACNAELVLLREDNELMPGDGYEVARGDELACWAQLHLAMKEQLPLSVAIDDGGWRVGDARYVWQMSTLHPTEYVPGLRILMLNHEQSERLLHRYKLAQRILSTNFKHHEVTKRLQYLSGPADTYRVNLHKLLHVLNDAGLTWETYCKEITSDQAMVPELPVGFVAGLIDRTGLKDPNILFARPTRSELARVDDDTLLRTLLPRIDHVRYRLVRDLSSEIQEKVRDAIEEFGLSVRMQALTSRGQFISQSDPLPYLVYASDGEDLRLTIEALGLVMYAGIIPYLFPLDGVMEKRPENLWPFAFGHSLYLDIDVAEGGAK